MIPKCTNKELGRLITAYEFGQLEESDRCRFEEHLMNCLHCHQELQKMGPLVFDLRENRAEILETLARKGVRFTISETPRTEASAGNVVKKFQKFVDGLKDLIDDFKRPVVWAPVAATIAVFLFLFLPMTRSTNPYLPYLDYSKPPLTWTTLRSPGAPSAEAQQLFDNGLEEYTLDRYKQAGRYFEKALELEPGENRWWLYLGLSRYLDRRPEAAISPLEKALTVDNKKVQATARWYLSQAWLARGEAAKAVPLLEETIRQGNDYTAQAEALLDRIRQIK